MIESDRLKMMQRHTHMMRKSFPNPSEDTKLSWARQDAHFEFRIRQAEMREAAEAAEIYLNSEVCVK